MLLPVFEYHSPRSLPEALELLNRHGESARILAGGTDLLVNMKRKVTAPEHLIGLEKMAELSAIFFRDGRLEIGAAATVASLAENDTVRERFEVLRAGAAALGSPQVRNRATIGGNICNARPAADLPLPLLVLDARVAIAGSAGKREVALSEFFLGPGKTVVTPREIVTAVLIDQPGEGFGAGYETLCLRRAMEISIVNAAASVTLSRDGSVIEKARVALGAVAPIPMRATRAESILQGANAEDGVFRKAALAAAQEARPITDHRGSAEYRREMVMVLTERALQKARRSALGEEGEKRI